MNPYLLVGIILLGILVLIFSAYLFLVAPGRRFRERMKSYLGMKFAHRGLHSEQIPENSLLSFESAIKNGYAIEIDVRQTKDGELVVFHDPNLALAGNRDIGVEDLTLDELREYRLSDTDERIPTLKETLQLVDGRATLLVEIKEDVGKYNVTEGTAKMLREYKGDFLVQSFNPLALARFRRLYPDVPLGLLSMTYSNEPIYRSFKYKIVERMLLNFMSRPDFISYNHTDYKNRHFRRVKKLFNPPTFCWTVRTAEEEENALKRGFDSIIFEKYLSPKE